MKIIERTKIWYTISIAIILVGAAFLLFRGMNFDIEFAGGTMVQIDIGQEFDARGDIEPIVREITGDTNPQVQKVSGTGGATQVSIKVKEITTEQIDQLYTAIAEKSMDIVNTGTRPVKISIHPAGNYISATVIPETLKSGEKGEVRILYYPDQKKDWGFVNDQMEIETDAGDKGSLGVVANICEDFSAFKKNNYQNAPQAIFSETEIKLGILKKNTTQKQEIYIQNAGKSDLIIRKIKTSDDQMLSVVPAKTIIKPGKKTKVTLTLNTDNTSGRKVKIVSFTLNDPKNTIVTCKLTGNVQ